VPVSLHTHSWYSLLEGVSSLESLLARAGACGHTALALTDTNNLYGAIAFADLAQAHGVRPLFGACLRQNRTRCVVLIGEPAGYRSLCRILSRLNLGEGDDPPARLPTLLCENADGLHVLADDWPLAEQVRDAYGPRLWLEVIRPRGPRPQHEEELLGYGKRLGVAPIASTAAHIATPGDYPTFRLITAVRQGMLLEQLPRLSITPDHHLVDNHELRRRFRDLPDAIRNSDALAEQLRSDVLPRDLVLPPPRLPRHLGASEYLGALCERGLRRREMGDRLDARQRLREELAVIQMGDMAGYFLVVRDIARYARHRGHPMALRGSAGNSLVCYLLEITDVDPLRFALPMERFLHPGRTDLPDIDLDFDWKVRDDVIAHVFQRHGARHTAMVSSHLYLQPRSAFREAAKLHGLSNTQISRLDGWVMEWLKDDDPETGRQGVTRSSPSDALPPPCLPVSLSPCPNFPLEPERWPRLVADARALQGRPHHLSIHPGGVVITPKPIEEYVPLQRAAKGIVITQFEKDAIERVGLVKIDLLGNRALATVAEADRPRRVRGAGHGARPVRSTAPPAGCPADDSGVLAILQQGDTLGVNQLESPAMRHLLLQMQPRGLDDVIQSLALIRPGAASIGAKELFIRRRRGLEPVRYLHPSLESVLQETLGLMLYEDDALRVLQALTGLDAPDADRLRKRIARHRTEEEARVLTAEYLAACARRGIPRDVAGDLWVQLAKFNRYSFCKSHAVSYGLIAWHALLLKVHAPLAFWTAALNNNQGMYSRRVYVEAIKRAGIALRLPCINRSAGPFTVEDGAIRTGLDAIASLDEALRLAIMTERQRHGPYCDLADFRARVSPGPEALALLIRCGALDFTGRTRPALFLDADVVGKAVTGKRNTEGAEAPSFFPLSAFNLPLSAEWQPTDYPPERRLHDEWAILGFTIGAPMMAMFRPRLPANLVGSRDLARNLGRRVTVAGLVATSRRTEMADGRSMQFITLEDEHGLIEVTLFPGTCPPIGHLTLGPYLATGSVEEQYGVVTLTARRIERWQAPHQSSP